MAMNIVDKIDRSVGIRHLLASVSDKSGLDTGRESLGRRHTGYVLTSGAAGMQQAAALRLSLGPLGLHHRGDARDPPAQHHPRIHQDRQAAESLLRSRARRVAGRAREAPVLDSGTG